MKVDAVDNVPDSFKLPDESEVNNPGIDLAIWERLRKRWAKQQDVDLIVTMAPSSPTSGETRGYVEERQSHIKSSVLVNYQQYYVLNALREKMIESTGDSWNKVKAVYHSGDLEFYFEY